MRIQPNKRQGFRPKLESAGGSHPKAPLPVNVLLAFDNTPASWSALEVAANFARALSGTLTIAHVVQPHVSMFDGASSAARAIASAREEAWELLGTARDRANDVVPTRLEVLSGEPADAIARHADELSVELIVVGSHRRSSLERLLVGSVSDAIMKRATRPVLVVPVSGRTRAAEQRPRAAGAHGDAHLAA